ncbi:cytochrome P450 [Xylaria cf. heliscus]|nr:cytochrome P450 [Xylaria cf. heliscus]
MGFYLGSLSWAYIVLIITLFYLPLVGLYRLYFHPLSKFPGPVLAALSRWYEAYYDVVCGGQYTFKIAELHRKYGTLPRITLHVSDPSFFRQLYSRDGRWDKYEWSMKPFGAPTATLHSLDSLEHKHRRAALNPFFSKANVAQKQYVIENMTENLCQRLGALSKGETINLGNAISALTRDIATDFILGKSFNHLQVKDFHADLATLQQNVGEIWRTTKHIPWYGPLMQSIPLSVVKWIGDKGLLTFLQYVEDMMKITMDISSQFKHLDSGVSHGENKPSPTIVHQILASDVSAADKTFTHLADEVITLTSAGMETTAHSLRVIIYHLYKNPAILHQLRAELESSSNEIYKPGTDGISLPALEALPYLNAVIMEALRLSTPIASRSQRIAPDRDVQYRQWRIPAGTPVGMTLLLMHRDEALYPEPNKFDPLRWLDSDGKLKRIGEGYEPFGRGSRICLGMHLAWTEMYIVIATLAQRFDFRLNDVGSRDIEPVSDKFMAATSRQNGFIVQVESRL